MANAKFDQKAHNSSENFDGYTGRGIIIYVKETITAVKLNSNYKYIEAVQIAVPLAGRNSLLIQCVYRSPNSDKECVEDLKNILSCDIINGVKYTHRLMFGDFNLKGINWCDQESLESVNHITSLFMEYVRDSFLYQHVREYTRYREGQEPSVLDLIFTNEEDMVQHLDYRSPMGNSDHISLVFTFITGSVNRKNVRVDKRQYFKGNYTAVNESLSSVNWQEELAHSDIEDAWRRFADIINKEISNNIPVRKSSHHVFNTPWMNNEALTSIVKKRKAWRKYAYCRNTTNWKLYTEARGKANSDVRKAKYEFEKGIAANIKTNAKDFWTYVRSKTKVKDSIEGLVDVDGVLHTENTKKASLLNDYFKSVFTIEDTQNIPEFVDRNRNCSIDTVDISEEQVEKLLSKLNVKKTQGTDNLHPKLLAESSKSIAQACSIIFRLSLSEGKLPSCWKEANVTAIHKKGDRSNPSNYRPISLTSVVCKTMEKIVRNELIEYMENNNLFSVHQHGFRSGRSCVTQLIEVIEKWTEETDNRNSVDVIYLDFQKAFDTVPHQRLLKKLAAYGIHGHLYSWIEDFLKERKQKVVLNGEESSWATVSSGIPQGSVLGPTLFLIYINDLPEVVDSVIKLFADDTKLYNRVNTVTDMEYLQKDLDNLVKWSADRQLRFNSSKCHHLHIGRETGFIYTMEEDGSRRTTVSEVKQEKDLGVLIDKDLKFQHHIAESVKKANRKLGLIRRSFSCLDKEIFTNLYKSIVRPNLEYGCTIWSVIYKKEAITLENVQRRATKLVSSIRHLTYSERLRALGIPTLQYRRLRADMIEVFKIFSGIDIIDRDIFPAPTSYITRGHSRKIQKKHSRTNIRKYSFSQRVVSAWNSLPEDVVTAKTLNAFKNKLNSHWKNMSVKFVPDCYEPEPLRRRNQEMDLRSVQA